MDTLNATKPQTLNEGAICPICKQANGCTMAAGHKAPYDCWCMDENFPAEVFERIPTELLNRACVCKNCLKEIQAEVQQSQA